jgi:autotransporter-associated beta strand protein
MFKQVPPEKRRRRLAVESLEERLAPATDIWTGGSKTSSNWSDAANWSAGVPVNGENLVFGSSPKVTITDDIAATNGVLPTYASLTFQAGGYTIVGTKSASEFAVTGQVLINQNLAVVTIGSSTTPLSIELASPTVGNNSQTITVNSGSTLDLVNQIISPANTAVNGQSLLKEGTGTLELDGNNTAYVGSITLAQASNVNGGVVVVTNGNALGQSLGQQITVTSGSEIQLKAPGTSTGFTVNPNIALKLNGAGVSNSVANAGALYNAVGNNTWAGNIELDSNVDIGVAEVPSTGVLTTLTLPGQITDLGAGHSLSKEGLGQLDLTYVSTNGVGNTYRGATIIDAGVLNLEDPYDLGNVYDLLQPQLNFTNTVYVNFNVTTGVGGTLQLDNENATRMNGAGTPVYGTVAAGFVVRDENLVLNGPGFFDPILGDNRGALENFKGNNTWTGNVQLGSAVPAGEPVDINVDSVTTGTTTTTSTLTNLLISGTITDPAAIPKGGPSDLFLNAFSDPIFNAAGTTQVGTTGTGRLILTAANTYTGTTTVVSGILNIEDSQALGLSTKTAITTVDDGAALELELQSDNLNGMIQVVHTSAQGVFTPVADSVTGSFRAMQFTDPLEVAGQGIDPISGVTIAGLIPNASDPAGTDAGVLNSVSGVNIWANAIALEGTGEYNAVGVEPDPNASDSIAYFTNDYSLTVGNPIFPLPAPEAGGKTGVLPGTSGTITDGEFGNANSGNWLSKVGTGQLILSTANSYGESFNDPVTPDITTDIVAGWVTIGNSDALGAINPLEPQTLQAYTKVESGAALQIKPFDPGSSVDISNNFILVGLNGVLGINHPFGLISQAGNLENLDGANTLSGIIQLDGDPAIGVEQVFPLASQGGAADDTTPSQLTVTGYMQDYTLGQATAVTGGFTKTGSQRLILQGEGDYSNNNTVAEGAVLLQSDTGLGSGKTNATTTVDYGLGTQIALDLTGATPGTTQFTLALSGTDAQGPLAGTTTPITLGSVAAANDLNIVNALTKVIGTTGDVTVTQSQTVSLTGVTAGTTTFTLTYLGVTTPKITYTGSMVQDAYDIQNALNALASIKGEGTVSVTATPGSPGVFQVIFEGGLALGAQPVLSGAASGTASLAVTAGTRFLVTLGGTLTSFDETLTPAVVTAPGGMTATVQKHGGGAALELGNTVTSQNGGVQEGVSVIGEQLNLDGNGDPALGDNGALTVLATNSTTDGPFNDPIIPTDNLWSGLVHLAGNTTIDVHQLTTAPGTVTNPVSSRLVIDNVIDDASNPAPDGSSLTLVGGGELDLDGINSYRGVTDISHGIMTAGASQALGGGGINPVQVVSLTGGTVGTTKFTLSFDGYTTTAITYTGTAADATAIQNALNALPSIGGAADVDGTATVSQTTTVSNGVVTGSQYTITLGGSLAGFSQQQVTATPVTGPGVFSEVQTVTINGGVANTTQFTLSFNGATTLPITYTGTSADPTAVQNALNGLSTIAGLGTVSVTQSKAGVFNIVFNGNLAGFNQSQVTGAVYGTAATGQAVVGATGVQGAGGTVVSSFGEVQTITLNNPVANGTQFQLNFNGAITPLITYTGNGTTDAAHIQAALNNLSTINGLGSVTVTPVTPGVFTVTFNGSLATSTQPAIADGAAVPTGLVSVTTTFTGGTLQLSGGITVAGEPLLVEGTGNSTASNVPTQWFQVGPAPITNGQTAGSQSVSGRVTSVAVDPRDSNIIYIATAGGGAWKTIDDGQSWRPLFDAIPEVQDVSVSGTAGTNFSITYNSPTGTSAGVSLPLGSTPEAVAAALDAQINQQTPGGLVTVTLSTSTSGGANPVTTYTYELTFGGALAGETVPLVSAASTGTAAVTQVEDGMPSLYTMYLGAIALDPNNPDIVYIGTGVAGTAPSNDSQATDNYSGVGIFESQDAGATWRPVADYAKGGIGNPFMGNAITQLQVDPLSGDLFVADSNDVVPGPLVPTTGTQFVVGIWRLNNISSTTGKAPVPGQFVATTQVGAPPPDGSIIPVGGWNCLTSLVSTDRATLDGSLGFIPDTAGPDDDFRDVFPQTLATGYNGTADQTTGVVTWSGLQVVDTVSANDGAGPGFADTVVYASLSTLGNNVDAFGSNGVYRAYGGATNSPIWYVGDPGTPVQEIQALTFNFSQLHPPTDYFDLNFDGSDSGAIIFNGPPADLSGEIQAILDGLVGAHFAGGTVSVSQASSGANQVVYDVAFTGTLALGTVPTIVFSQLSADLSGSYVSIVQAGGGVDARSSDEFPTAAEGDAANGEVKLSAVGGGTVSTTTVYAITTDLGDPALPPEEGGYGLNGVFFSATGGLAWSNVTGNLKTGVEGPLYTEGDYAIAIAADPNAPGTVYVGGTIPEDMLATGAGQIFKSTVSGTTWSDISTDTAGDGPHSGQHAFVVVSHGAEEGDLLAGGDGGIFEYGSTPTEPNVDWNDLNSNLADALVNQVASTGDSPTDLFAAVQDNGVVELSNGASLAWSEVDPGGKPAAVGIMSGEQVVGPYFNPQTGTTEIFSIQYQEGSSDLNYGPVELRESTDGGKTWTTVTGTGGAQVPLVVDPLSNGQRLLVGGGGDVFESLDGGNTFTDLGPGTLAGNLTSIAIAQYQGAFQPDPTFPDVTDQGADNDDSQTVYVTDGTNIALTKDDGQLWVDRSIPGVTGNITQLVVDPDNRDTVFAILNQYQGTSGNSNVYVSTDAGQSWTALGVPDTNNSQDGVSGLPDVPVQSLVVDPRNGNLYVGTNNGVYQLQGAVSVASDGPVTINTGGAWTRFGVGLYGVEVKDLELNQTTNTLVAGTYGRSVYELFLSASETTPTPVFSTVVALSGTDTWSAGPVVVQGGSGTVAGAGVSNTVTFGADGFQGLPSGISEGQLVIQGAISDATPNGNATIEKIGEGAVAFSTDNVYGGATVVSSGTLVAGSYQALGLDTPTAGLVYVDDGASLDVATSLDAKTIYLAGDGQELNGHSTGALESIGGDNTLAGTIVLSDAADPQTGSGATLTSTTIGVASGSTLTLTGQVTGGGAAENAPPVPEFNVIKEGTGTLVLDPTAAGGNTFTGLTSVLQGVLELETGNAIDNNPTGPEDGVEVLDGAQVELTGGVTVNASLVLSGTGVNGTGALLSVSGNNTWGGPGIVFASLAGFEPPSFTSGSVLLAADNGATLTIAAPITDDYTAGSVDGGIITGTAPVSNSGALEYAGGVPQGLTVGDYNTDATGQPGTGSVVLQAADSYNGATYVEAGALVVENPLALGDRNNYSVGGGTLQTVYQVTTDNALTTAQGSFTLTFNGMTTADLPFGSSPAAVQAALVTLFKTEVADGLLPGPASQYANAVSVTQGSSSNIPGTAQAVSIGGQQSFVYTVNFEGVLAQTPLQLTAQEAADTSALGSTGTFASASLVAGGDDDVVVESGAELQLNGSLQGDALTVSGRQLTLNGNGIATLADGALHNVEGNNTWAGPVILDSNGTGVASVGADFGTSLTLAGVITGSELDVNLTPNAKSGVDTGTVIFPDTMGYNQGLTVLDGGSAQVDGVIGTVELNGGTLSGNGSVTYLNTGVGSGGTIDPGDNVQGDTTAVDNLVTGNDQLTLLSNTTLTPSDQVFLDLATIGNDMLLVDGSIDLGEAVLAGNVDPNIPLYDPLDPAAGGAFTILQTDLSSNPGAVISGEFASGEAAIPATQALLYQPGNSSNPYAATVAFLGGEKFEVDYFSDHIVLLRELASATLTVSGSVTPSATAPVYGQDEVVTATLTPEPGAPAPTGNIVFNVTDPTGGVTQYTEPLVNGAATFDPAAAFPLGVGGPLQLGFYSVTAAYDGTENGVPVYNPVNTDNDPFSFTVQPAPTTTTLTESAKTAVYGSNVTLTATVVSGVSNPVAGTVPPTGTVSFYSGSGANQTLLGTVQLSQVGGVETAVLQTSQAAALLTFGLHSLTAVYNADGLNPNFYTTSTSAPVTQTVTAEATQVSLASSPASPSVYGQAVTFTATVTPKDTGDRGVPVGTVTFRDNTTGLTLGTAQLTTTNGVTTASVTTGATQLGVATHNITAQYNDNVDSDFVGSSGTLSQVVTKDATVVTVASTPANPVLGNTVTITATVSPNGPLNATPTGTVTFKDTTTGQTLGGGAISLVNGVATVNVATFTAATHNITVTYSGDANFAPPSPAPTYSLTVAKDNTTAILTSSSSTSTYGQSVTYTFTVTSQGPLSAAPTGTVTFLDSTTGTPLGTVTQGTASGQTTTYTLTTSQVPVQGGQQTITANYAGDSNYAANSASTGQTVNAGATTTSVTSSTAVGVEGQLVSYTVTVAPTLTGGGTPTGTVTLTDQATGALVGSGTLSGGKVVIQAPLTAPVGTSATDPTGQHTIVASFSSDNGNYSTSTGSTVEHVVPTGNDASNTTISSNAPKTGGIASGTAVTFTAVVTAVGTSLTPTGSVTFMDTVTLNGVTGTPFALGTAQLMGNSAVLSTTGLQVGTNVITAVYSGDANFAANNHSPALTQLVVLTGPRLSATTLSPSSSTTVFGQTLNVVATVVDKGTAPAIVPTGTLIFTDTTTGLTLATETLNGVGSATLSVSSLGLGKHTIVASYSGDQNFAPESSAAGTFTVAQSPTTTTVQASTTSSTYGQPVALTATVTPSGGGSGTPTGLVTFYANGTAIGTAGLNGGLATFTYSGLGVGADTITASYGGDADFLTSTSSSAGAVTVSVGQAATTTTLGVSAAKAATPLTFTAAVASTMGAVPGGSVTFYVDGVAVGSAAVGTNGLASFVYSAGVSQGYHTITAVYGANTDYASSAGSYYGDFIPGRGT